MNYISRYAGFLKRYLNLTHPLRVVFDFSNGPAAKILPVVLRGYRNITPVYMDRRLSGNFPAHGPNPMVKKAGRHLARHVVQSGADMGVIFDADGDRAFIADARGRILEPQMVAYLLFLFRKPPYVLDEITYTLLRKAGLLSGEAHLCRVGSIFIKRMMKAARATTGVEYSGHFYFNEFFYVDSGLMTAIQVMNAASRLPYSLADYYDFFPKTFSTLRALPTRDPHKHIEDVIKVCRTDGWGINRLDGALCDGGETWMHARASNTEPLLRVFASGASPEKVKTMLRALKLS